MKRISVNRLKRHDMKIADVTIGDQISLIDRAVVAQHLPSDCCLLLVSNCGDSELWVRGPRQSKEVARGFFLGWRAALRNASVPDE